MDGSVDPLHRLRTGGAGRCAPNGRIAAPAPLTPQAMAAAGREALTADLQPGTAAWADLLSIFPIIEGRRGRADGAGSVA